MKKGFKDKITKEYLVEHWIKQRKSLVTIANELNVSSPTTISKYIQRFNLQRPDLITKEILLEKYVEKNKSLKQIAKELGIRSKYTIRRYINIYKLKRKDFYSKTSQLNIEDIKKKYLIEKMYIDDIAKELNVSTTTIRLLLKKLKIHDKHPSRYTEKWKAAIKKRCKGYGEISGAYWRRIITGAETRGICFEISTKDAWDLFIKQNGKCTLSGVKLIFSTNKNNKNEQTASLDRIDSNQGYIKGNIQWIHKKFQKMKNSKNMKEFIEDCKEVVKYYESIQ